MTSAPDAVLSAVTLQTLLRWRGVVPHPALGVVEPWTSEDGRARLDRLAIDELTEHGRYGPSGVDEELEFTLSLLRHPSWEVYGWFTARNGGLDRRHSVLGVSDGEHACLVSVVPDPGVVSVVRLWDDELRDAFLDQLPECPDSRRVDSVTAPCAAVDGRDLPGRSGDANEIRRIIALPRTAEGCMYVASTGRDGRRVRCDHPLGFVDTSRGRWVARVTSSSGEPWVTLIQAPLRDLGARLDEERRSLVDRLMNGV